MPPFTERTFPKDQAIGSPTYHILGGWHTCKLVCFPPHPSETKRRRTGGKGLKDKHGWGCQPAQPNALCVYSADDWTVASACQSCAVSPITANVREIRVSVHLITWQMRCREVVGETMMLVWQQQRRGKERVPLYFCQLLFLSSKPFERGITHSSHCCVFHKMRRERDISNTKKGGERRGRETNVLQWIIFLEKKGMKTPSSAL